MEVRLRGGFCVVASAVTCFDVLSDLVALRGRISADGAAARQRCSSSTGIPGARGWRDPDSKRSGAGAIGRYAASDHGGYRT